jgi:glycerol-3-phosphate cytidylyltransferase
MRTAITYGTFDMFHYGHLRLLERARDLADRLLVGVSTDELTESKKRRKPVYPLDHRMSIVKALRCVSGVFVESDLMQKASDIEHFGAALLVMGDDWAGKWDDLKALCQVVYIPRTPDVSTTETIERINHVHHF